MLDVLTDVFKQSIRWGLFDENAQLLAEAIELFWLWVEE